MTRVPIRFVLAVALAALIGTGTLRADDKKAAVKELQRALEEADRKAKLLEKRLAESAKVAEKIRELNAELEGQTPKKALPQAPAPREKRPPLPQGIRGTVEDVAGDLLVISIGRDAGLKVGSTLNVYRTGGAGEEPIYLGKVKLTSSSNLYPKQAVVSFLPAGDVPFKELKPTELPRKGDTVRTPVRPTD